MTPDVLESLRFQGYSPRTLLDVGADAGAATQGLLQTFPDCVSTLIAPDQAAGLDDAFAGHRFDFVRIDAEGSELEVLSGGQAVLRQADYILIQIALADTAQAEPVLAQLAALGFRAAQVTDVQHQEFLFERAVRRPTQNYRYGPLHGHGPVMDYLRDQKAKCPDFSVIDVGAAANPWSGEVLDATFDMGDCAVAPLHFRGNFNDSRSWDEVLRHVAKHGRFSYAICSHTLEDLAYPAVALEMLPRIAEAGYVCVPSRYLESLRPEGPYRGFIHHRWVLDNVGQDLVLASKIPLVEFLTMDAEPTWGAQTDRFEFQMHWRGAIAFNAINGDYLGPNRDAVINMYSQFFNRP